MNVAFIGHRAFTETHENILRIKKTIETLILEENADTFYFGSKSNFDSVCYDIVTELKEIYPQIKRIYARSANEYLGDVYIQSILKYYEDTVFPPNVTKAGKSAYIKRNEFMINQCDVLITYYDENYIPHETHSPTRTRNSGTKIAVQYALKHHKRIINLF